MKIVNLKAENIKRLEAIDITPVDNMVEITGRNGAGKTSVLDSIWWALAGKSAHQAKPIREGQEFARIQLDLGELRVIREFNLVSKNTEDGKTEKLTTRIKVETDKGARYPSPQSMLDSLLSSLTFDPMRFLRMAPREQYDSLHRLLGLDFTDMNVENQADFSVRRDLQNMVKERRAAASQISFPDDTPEQPVDVAALMQELEDAQNHNERVGAEAARRERLAAEIVGRREAAEEKVKQIVELQAKLQQLEVERDELRAIANEKQEQLMELPPLDKIRPTDDIRQKLIDSQNVNRNVEKRVQRDRLNSEGTAAQQKAVKLTERMEKRKQKMQEQIEAANMPVPGLGLGNGVVLFNNLPLDQASDAEQLRVSCAIAMRTDAELRVIRVRDGSLLDDNGMKVLAEMAKELDYQIWIERVDTSGEVGFYIEEGKVASE